MQGENPATAYKFNKYVDAGVTVAGWTEAESGEYMELDFSVETTGLPVDTSVIGEKEITYTLKYKDKEIKFHSDVELVTQLQSINELAKEEMVLNLAERNKTINDLIKKQTVDGKTVYDNSNVNMLLNTYTEKIGAKLYQEAVKKMCGFNIDELVEEIGITEVSEQKKLAEELGKIMVGRFQDKGQQVK
jgi:hypothetical protein